MFNIINLEEVTSTMDLIKNYPVETIIVASKQTNGRGKDDRNWISNKSNNLYMTLSIRNDNDNIDYSHYSFLSSLSVIETIKSFLMEEINIKSKWPNDVLINNKKFCGILLERDIQKKILSIGIGINIDSHPELNEKMIFQPTDLLNEGFSFEKDKLLEKFVSIFEKFSDRFIKEGFGWLRKEWLGYAYNLGREITIGINNVRIKGTFEDLDKNGTLLLKNDNNIVKIRSGDIF